MNGKLIVIEGSDGAGKATQLELLQQYLTTHHYPVRTVDFPRYDKHFGKMIAAFLRGEYGPLETVPPPLIAVIYAMDRAEIKPQMEQWLREGDIILANRYVTSNMAHQSARLPESKREEFLSWIEEFEYEVNHIPREDVVIYLYMPHHISQELITKKSHSQRLYAHGKEKDIAESDINHMKQSEESYLDLLKCYSHWVKIVCVDKEGKLKTKEAIHEEIIKVLKRKKLLSSS